MLLSGFTPSRGITGDIIDVSGEGFGTLREVRFVQPATSSMWRGMISGSNAQDLVKVTIPSEATSIRGKVDMHFIGGAGGVLRDFEIIDDTSALEFNVVDPATATIPTAAAGQVVEYTIEETVDGVVWYITYKQYPDGTKVIVSSFPKSSLS